MPENKTIQARGTESGGNGYASALARSTRNTRVTRAEPEEYSDPERGDNVFTLTAKLDVFIGAEKPGLYAVYCPALGEASCGESIADAKRMIVECIEGLLQTYTEDQRLEWFFADCKLRLAPNATKRKLRPRKLKVPAYMTQHATHRPYKRWRRPPARISSVAQSRDT